MVVQKKNELCVDLVETGEQAISRKNEYIQNLTAESEDEQTTRLVREFDLIKETNVCEFLLKQRVEQSKHSIPSRLNLAKFKLKNGRLEEAEALIFGILQEDTSLRRI